MDVWEKERYMEMISHMAKSIYQDKLKQKL